MSTSVRIVRSHVSRFDQVVAFVAQYNPRPEHHVGYFGLTPEDIRLTLRMFNWPFERAARLALDGNRLIGVLAADIDKELGRAWLYGPLVAPDAVDAVDPHRLPVAAWDATADALYSDLAPRLPAGIREHEMFVDAANVCCRAFAARHGFATVGESAIYYLTPDRLAQLPAAEAEPWDERYADQFAALHERLFPRSNYTLSYMRKEWSENGATLLLATDGPTLRGYFFGRVEAEAGEAYVDLIGVDEESRRTGLGRRLMLAGLARLRGTPGLRQVNLTVAAGNGAAIALYDALGFTRERNMVAFRRPIGEET